MADRDPRVDPKAGDVLLKRNGWVKATKYAERRIEVISVAHGAVRINSTPIFPGDAGYFLLGDWPFLMRNAEVIHRAE